MVYPCQHYALSKLCFEMKVTHEWLFKTVSGHFFTVHTFILWSFTKLRFQMVILRCLMGLNFNWFETYGPRCSLRPRMSSVNSQKIATDKWPFYNHIWPFFANYMNIFYKTEIQTVNLRCLPSLNLSWYKSYDIKTKNAKNANVCFCTKSQKKWNAKNENICILCHNYWTN